MPKVCKTSGFNFRCRNAEIQTCTSSSVKFISNMPQKVQSRKRKLDSIANGMLLKATAKKSTKRRPKSGFQNYRLSWPKNVFKFSSHISTWNHGGGGGKGLFHNFPQGGRGVKKVEILFHVIKECPLTWSMLSDVSSYTNSVFVILYSADN